jgi:uncharacterized membrane protein YeaQ/YmgE (transglycosylase-associated protein family)
MGLIAWIIVGFVAGLLARFFYPGAVDLNFWLTLAIGLVGSLIGGLVSNLISGHGLKIQRAGLLWSIGGALVALWIYLTYIA